MAFQLILTGCEFTFTVQTFDNTKSFENSERFDIQKCLLTNGVKSENLSLHTQGSGGGHFVKYWAKIKN